jgi:hypothetical protein
MIDLNIQNLALRLHDTPTNQFDLYATKHFQANKLNPHTFCVGDGVVITNSGLRRLLPDEHCSNHFTTCRCSWTVDKIYTNLTDTRSVVILINGNFIHKHYIGID